MRWRLSAAAAVALLPALVLQAAAAGEEGTCAAGASAAECVGKGVGQINVSACEERGFDPRQLTCNTCRTLQQRFEEAGVSSDPSATTLVEDCLGCCRPPAVFDKFTSARLMCDAKIQEQDTDVHDFIKRKAPLISGLEVEYLEGSKPVVELEHEDDPSRILRAEVGGWKSEHLVEFFESRLEAAKETSDETSQGKTMLPEGAYTAEVQSCSGWRLNQLPEVRKFIKEPGHADTYRGLKVNFIPHHNPDLVFFDEHGKEIERLDLGRYNCDQIHELMQEKGFSRKKAKKYLAEIRTCSGWALNRLPEVRRFILEPGNADAYIGVKINFIPHHHPELILFDEDGKEKETIDMAPLSFKDLAVLFNEQGFKKKEML